MGQPTYIVTEDQRVTVVTSPDQATAVIPANVQGPPGPRGEQGPTGLPGPNRVDDSTQFVPLSTGPAAAARSAIGTDAAGDARPPAAHTHPAAQISDSTATGRALLTATDAPTARNAIGAAATSGTLAQFAATTSAELAGVLTDETGSGSVVFSASPTLVTPTVSGALTVTGGTVTASTPILNATQTWNNSGVNFTALSVNVTPTARGSGSKLLDLQTAGASRVQVTFNEFGYAEFGVRHQSATTFCGISPGNAGDMYFFTNASMTGAIGTEIVATVTTSRFVIEGGMCYAFYTGAHNTSVVLGHARFDDNTVEINTGTRTASGGSLRDLRLRNLTATGLIYLGPFTVGTLPSASANVGALAQATDSNSTTRGATPAGGGSNRVIVFATSTGWVIV